jgi:hypothetical protein
LNPFEVQPYQDRFGPSPKERDVAGASKTLARKMRTVCSVDGDMGDSSEECFLKPMATVAEMPIDRVEASGRLVNRFAETDDQRDRF